MYIYIYAICIPFYIPLVSPHFYPMKELCFGTNGRCHPFLPFFTSVKSPVSRLKELETLLDGAVGVAVRHEVQGVLRGPSWDSCEVSSTYLQHV